MKHNKYLNLVSATSSLYHQGFNHNFTLKSSGLIDFKTDKVYQAKDLMIVEHHRFKGMNSANYQSVIFAVECLDGIKGIIISATGSFAYMQLINLMDKVKVKISAAA